ncbi:hypothetical protein ACFVVA_38265 [Kitasatospora sp. NPDC058048]|uniref:hypothetical protein n=1 Tax=Kitasatospora sp. NPDC058048 TaxID=3346313 RepID=UPI0036DF1BBC
MIKTRTLAAAAATALLALGVAAAPASAAPAPNGPTIASVQTITGSPDSTGTIGGSCPAPVGNGAPAAPYLCGTNPIRLDWTDGRFEYVLLGTDRRVWHTYQTTANGPWTNWDLFGDSSDVQNGVWFKDVYGTPSVVVTGSVGTRWCNSLNSSGTWTNWYHCPPAV